MRAPTADRGRPAAIALPGALLLAALLAVFPAAAEAQLQAEGSNQLRESTTEVDVPSPEGRFRIVWPAGCSRLRTRTFAREDPTEAELAAADTLARVVVMCDRRQRDQQGAMVTVIFPVMDGPEHTPDDVAAMIGGQIANSNQQILRQGAIERNGMKGVRVLAREREGERSSWIEGFIAKGRIVVAMAWKPDQSVFTSPEIERFFDTLAILD